MLSSVIHPKECYYGSHDDYHSRGGHNWTEESD